MVLSNHYAFSNRFSALCAPNMVVSQRLQWVLVIVMPYAVLGAVTHGAAWLLLPLGGLLGIFSGFTMSNSFFTPGFKVALALACAASVTLVAIGLRLRRRWWGKLLSAGGVYLWCVAGVIGFGPQ